MQNPLAGICRQHRRADTLGHNYQGSARTHRAATYHNQGSLRLGQDCGCFLDGVGVGHRSRRRASHRPAGFHQLREHVPRQRQMHGTGPARIEHRISTRHQLRNFLRMVNHGAELGKARGSRALIIELVRCPPAFAQGRGGAGSRQDNHRDGIAIGLSDGGRGICHPRAGDDGANSRLPGGSGITVSHQSGALLVTALHMTHTRSCDTSIELHGVGPRHTKNRVHPVVSQQFHQGLATGELLGQVFLPLSLCHCAWLSAISKIS